MARTFAPTKEQAKKVRDGNSQLEDGSYHGQIVDGYQSEEDADIFEVEVLAGTMQDCVGMKRKFFFNDDEKGTIKLAKFCVAAGVLTTDQVDAAAEQGTEIDFEPILENIVGKDLCFTLKKGSFNDRETGEKKDVTYQDFYHVDSKEAKGIPKDPTAALRLKAEADNEPEF